MRVLVACERSGIIRDAFITKGHHAVSCDLQPSERPGPHIQDDVLKYINDGWDLMVAHPECKDIAVSGARHFKDKNQQPAIDFFMAMVNAPIKRISVENPVGIMSTLYRKPDQYIQPYYFGEDASKKTGLWLKGLPKLTHTKYIPPRIVNGRKRWGNQTDSGQNKLGPSEHRSMDRARTYPGIAAAMADQWG